MRARIRFVILVLLIASSRLLVAAEFSLVTLDYPPYEYQADGEVRGVATEIVREAFARMGHTAHIQILPWPRVLWMVEMGKVDGFFTAYHTPDRERWADYSREELVPQVTSLFVLKNSPIAYSGQLAELKGQTIGVVAKVSYGTRFDQAVRNGILTVAPSLDGETNFRQLFAGRVAIVASNREGAKFILHRMGRFPEVREVKPPLESIPSFLAFSKRRHRIALREQFDRVLAEMKSDGTWQRLMKDFEP